MKPSTLTVAAGKQRTMAKTTLSLTAAFVLGLVLAITVTAAMLVLEPIVEADPITASSTP